MNSKVTRTENSCFFRRNTFEVRCNRCKWQGTLNQMKAIYNLNPSDPTDVIGEVGCPVCLSDQWLEYEELTCYPK